MPYASNMQYVTPFRTFPPLEKRYRGRGRGPLGGDALGARARRLGGHAAALGPLRPGWPPGGERRVDARLPGQVSQGPRIKMQDV